MREMACYFGSFGDRHHKFRMINRVSIDPSARGIIPASPTIESKRVSRASIMQSIMRSWCLFQVDTNRVRGSIAAIEYLMWFLRASFGVGIAVMVAAGLLLSPRAIGF